MSEQRPGVQEAAATDVDGAASRPVRGDMSAVMAFRDGVFSARRYLEGQRADAQLHAAPHVGGTALVSPDVQSGPVHAA